MTIYKQRNSTYNILFIHVSVDGHTGRFHNFAVVNRLDKRNGSKRERGMIRVDKSYKGSNYDQRALYA